MNTINIGLFGFGVVGKGFYQSLPSSERNLLITKICVKDPLKEREAPRELFTTNASEILNDDSISIVVELTDDCESAFRIVSQALRKGKPVVSANKKMISTYIRELIALQKRYKTPLLYEASCCASIPIIRSLEDYYSGPWLESLEGIVNGSTNYILSNIFSDGTSYTESLLEAQSLGYAESNPILDTGGFDARSKLSIMIAHAFGVITREKDIACIGIHDLHEDTIGYARLTGHRIKLIARTWKSEGRISAVVAPHLVRTGHQLFDVSGVFNGVAARSRLSNTQFYHGEGAGSQPTANAVLSDVHAIQNGYRYRYEKLSGPAGVRLDNQIPVKVSLILGKHHASDEIPVIIDSKKETDHGILIEGRISLNEIELLHALYPGRVLIQS